MNYLFLSVIAGLLATAWVAEGKPSLYSCSLKILNNTRSPYENILFNFECGHDSGSFSIDERGAKIPSYGARGHITQPTPPCACGDVEQVNSSLSWAAVVRHSPNGDCSVLEKAHNVWMAGYVMVLLVPSEDCRNQSVPLWNSSFNAQLPIISTDEYLGGKLVHFSVPIDEGYLAAEVVVNAVYVDFVLLWTVFGVTVAVTIACTLCCFCIFFVFRGVATTMRRQGLSRWSLRKLVQRKYNKGHELYETCAICLEEFDDGEMIRVLPCEHIYHLKCVDEWLMKWNRVCPVCKRVILRNERRATNQGEDDDASIEELPNAAATPAHAASDSDSQITENIPLLTTIVPPTNDQQPLSSSYGTVVRGDEDLASGHNPLEACVPLHNATPPPIPAEEENDISASNQSIP